MSSVFDKFASPIVQETTNISLEKMACFAMSVFAAGGGIYGYLQKRSLPSLIAGVGVGLLYGYSGRLISMGRQLDGVNLALVTSGILLAAMGPRAYRTRAIIPSTLAGIASVLLLRMGIFVFLT
jgi:uncharacterized membrane protein (UPF0136 family)